MRRRSYGWQWAWTWLGRLAAACSASDVRNHARIFRLYVLAFVLMFGSFVISSIANQRLMGKLNQKDHVRYLLDRYVENSMREK